MIWDPRFREYQKFSRLGQTIVLVDHFGNVGVNAVTAHDDVNEGRTNAAIETMKMEFMMVAIVTVKVHKD